MRLVQVSRATVYAFAAAVGAACGGDGPTGSGERPPPAPLPNFVRLESDVGDHVGGGGTYAYSQANSIITLTPHGRLLRVIIRGDDQWSGEFAVPSGVTRFHAATYTGIISFPNQGQAQAGLLWSREGRFCKSFSGSFTVDSATYVDTTLTAIALRFVQSCNGGTPALRGTIHWRSDDGTRPPPPVSPPPAGLWQPPSASIPASGSYVYLQSDGGDYVGAGQTFTYTPATASIAIAARGRGLSVSVAEWSGWFEAMNSIAQLQVGYYGSLRRYPFHNPTLGGLTWQGMGRGCNTLTGWFVVDLVMYAGSTLTALDLRFVQHCNGLVPALRGAIRWRA